ncbi:hypothetical protein SAMN06297144_0081 [Sphingomonas guangdongensis]|uniref:Uncharacterized protein n=1 Tax=Sphingomonas guangdongensis TaxID=1141890 RepID=A0A285Q9F7_9SPHN|nr:hypothetical protein [Sphingomonas guangdongensis]SOB78575.1 hypothetical protein SAMN06297144_0081 [Sphingomonas guangdongensis]
MKPSRTLVTLALAGAAALPRPAAAQFFFQPPKLTGAPVTGAEPGIVAQPLPGATPEELRAALVWNLRAGLNVAALQCQFKPTLLSLYNYNKILGDHGTELNAAYATLGKYFERTAKTKKAGQTALDQYGTRVYSSFSTVGAQLTFCQTASEIAHLAIFAPRGSFGTLASERMQELRNSLVLAGEQRFPWFVNVPATRLPALDDRCWRKGEWQPKKCGPQLWG